MPLVQTFWRFRVVSSGLAGGPYLTTLNVGPADEVQASVIAPIIREFLVDLSAQVSANLVFNLDPAAQVVDAATGDIISESEVSMAQVNGTKTQAAEWTAKQGILYYKTGVFVLGKRLAGRIFVPGVVADAGEQTPVTGYTSVVTGAFADYRLALEALNVAPVCVRRPNTASSAAGAAATVTTHGTRPYWGVLRSRRD